MQGRPLERKSVIDLLLVEDNVVQKFAVRTALQKSQPRFQIHEAETLQEGLEFLGKQEPDIILLDLSLPDSDSLATLSSIQQAAPAVPIVILSGEEDKRIAIDALQRGAQDFLVKSAVNSELLTRSLRYAIERKRADQLGGQLASLMEPDTYFGHVFDNSPLGIFVADMEGRFLMVNKVFCSLLQYTEEELRQMNYFELTDSEDLADTIRLSRELNETCSSVSRVSKRYVRKSGEPIWVRVSVSMLCDAKGQPVNRLCVVEDATSERLANAMLQAQLQIAKMISQAGQLSEIAASFLQAVAEPSDWQYAELWLVNKQSESMRLSQSWGVPGLNVDEIARASAQSAVFIGSGLPGTAWRDGRIIYATDLSQEGTPEKARLLRSKGFVSGVCIPIISGDEVLGVFSLFKMQVGVPDKEAFNLFSFAATLVGQFLHRIEAEEKTRKGALLEQREEFIATLAHDLKTPIAGAIRLFDLMIDGAVGEFTAAQREIIEKLKASNESQLRMIKNLLQVYRYDSGVQVIQLEDCYIEKLVDRCLADIAPIADSVGVTLEKEVAQQTEPISADSIAIARVLQNLLENALKFTPKGGKVCVSAKFEQGGSIISVSDTGSGIAPSVQARLFQRWHANAGSSTVQGTGLGLYLCRQIVEAHGGEISVLSQGTAGQGSTFTFSLPVHRLSESLR